MNLEKELHTLHQFGVQLGLERMTTLLNALGNPHLNIPAIHVAGTNGKGSVCAYLSSVLTRAGYRVGRYTSPHLLTWNERICINEQPISTTALDDLLQQIKSVSERIGLTPTQFETLTAAAFVHFACQPIDIGVIEVGLGGRLDATNVFSQPLLTIITSIGFDHCQQLGFTLSSIAIEKAGILKPACPAVIGSLPAEARGAIAARLQRLECPVVWAEPAVALGQGWIRQGELKCWLPLQGKAQLMNAGIAISALRLLQQQGWLISDVAIAEGMAQTQWLGRLQWGMWHNQRVLIDGAHNVEAAVVLRQFIDDQMQASPATRYVLHWVIGMFADKDQAGILQTLLRPGESLYTVPIDIEPWAGRRAATPTELATLAQSLCPTLAQCQSYNSLWAALEAAKQGAIAAQSSLEEHWIVVCGSLYLAGELLPHLRPT